MRILVAASLLFLIACNNADKKEDVKVAGAWKMLSQNLKSEKTDTTDNTTLQLKIFGDGFMMYAHVSPTDSVSGFGVGSYSSMADTVSEHVIYSASDSTKDEEAHSYKLAIAKTEKGYMQVIPDITGMNGEHFKLTEEYETAGTDTKTPLDGLWKLTKAIQINSKDTALGEGIQYKAYFAGNVMWGNTYTDSLKKSHTGIGFGKFEMKGNDKLTENMIASTYSAVRGQQFDIDIVLNGADEFTQTLTTKDGTKEIETYQRVKK